MGAVFSSLVIGIAGMTSDDGEIVRGAYVMLEVVGWYVLVPLSMASLLSGLVCSWVTTWGVFRHYWVVAKLVMNIFAVVVLLMYMQTLADLADSAVGTASPALHAGAALVLLLAATVLGIYKPRGLTRYGWRKQQAHVGLDGSGCSSRDLERAALTDRGTAG